MKVLVYYNKYNRIVSILNVNENKDVPPAGIFPIPDSNSCEIELTAEQSKIPLIALHIGYDLDFSHGTPRLVPLKPKKHKDHSRTKS